MLVKSSTSYCLATIVGSALLPGFMSLGVAHLNGRILFSLRSTASWFYVFRRCSPIPTAPIPPGDPDLLPGFMSLGVAHG